MTVLDLAAATEDAVLIEDRPVDAARAFLGPNASYYDEAWRVMAWRGRRWSWNASAFLYGPMWFAWRRMDGPALAYILGIVLLEVLWLKGLPQPVPALGLFLLMTLAGGHANGLYLRRFLRINRRLERHRLDAASLEAALKAQGGVNPVLLAGAALCLILGLLGPLAVVP